MMRTVLTLLILGLMTGAANSQDIVLKGKITDRTDKSVISGATITLGPAKSTVKTRTNPIPPTDVTKDSSTKVIDTSKLIMDSLGRSSVTDTTVPANKIDTKPVSSAPIAADNSGVPIQSTVSDNNGNFNFSGLVAGNYTVTISSLNYEKVTQNINLQASNKTAIPFAIAKISEVLGEVTVTAKAQAVRQRGDTSEFSASQFKVNPDATAEDMMKKLPGITVDRSGNVTSMGEQVKKVTVDGRDFFGDDATAALKNLPADVIDKIQVFDKLSDQAQLTGFDDGNSVKTINIVTKSGIKNGQFGRIYAGYGTDDRYSAGGNVSFFKGNRRLSFVGNFNNINQQNFGSQDLLGVTSSSGGNRGGRGGGGRGGGPQGGGGGDNFQVGQSSGISKTNALGINFSNQYGKKLTLSGSYFYNNSSTNDQLITKTEQPTSLGNFATSDNSNTYSTNTNHRINLRLEYKIDSSNSLFIIPSMSFQKNNSSSTSFGQAYYENGDSTSASIGPGRSSADKNGFNIRNNILFRHAFAKRGRSLSLGFNTTFTKNDGESITDSKIRYYQLGHNNIFTDSILNRFYDNTTNGNTIGGNIAYTEPMGKKGQIQADYTLSVQNNKADQEAFDYDGVQYSKFNNLLSNRFDNTVTTNNAGLNYRLNQSRDEQFSVGVNFQHSQLESQRTYPTEGSINQSFSNLLPNLMWRKKLSTVSNIRIFYRASVNFPSITQLQDVVNTTDPTRVSIGNPALKQSYANFLAGRYTYTNSKTSTSFFANLLLQTAADYVATQTNLVLNDSLVQNIKILSGTQVTKPVNVDGYKSLRTFFTYSMPLKALKTTMNVNAGFSYSFLPGRVNDLPTKTNNYVYNAGVVLASNISEYVDFNLSYTANFNDANSQSINVKTNQNINTITKTVNQTTGIQVNLLDKKGWFLQNDVTGQTYTGLSAGLNQTYWLWNAALGKKILKNQAGELKLSVFDLLKQNQSITHTVSDGGLITDSQSQVLQQYFLLTFTYKLKNFGTAKTTTNNNNRGNFGPGGAGQGGRPGGQNGGFGPGF
ncbi:MAG: TonB-dependent receptor [Ferruginibacter sp.]